MGNDFCNCNFFGGGDEEKKEENISYIQNQQLSVLSGKNKNIFYFGSTKIELLPNGKLDPNPSIRIKQIYLINRIKFLTKKIREFLSKKRVYMTTIGSTLTGYEKNKIGFNTLMSTNKHNYINTDMGEIAKRNLSLIQNQNYKKRAMIKYFIDGNNYDNDVNEDGVIYLKMIDDSELCGIYYHGALNGFTKISFINKDTFKGEIFDDKANGYGIYYFSQQGCAYEGDFENNYKNGFGVETWWYDASYQGEFSNGKKNGIGIYKWKDNSFYSGEWVNNLIHGYGIFKNINKNIYKGQFNRNSLEGYGEMTYFKTNSFYYGFWSKNKRNGFGVELSPRKNGKDKIYVGFWEKNDRYGYGVLLTRNDNDGIIYAVWKKNKISRQFFSFEEFSRSVKQLNYDKYLYFFERTYEENFIIIQNIQNHENE